MASHGGECVKNKQGAKACVGILLPPPPPPPPPTLTELCFAVIRRQKVLERVLEPLKLVKRTSGTNTDNDDQAENDDTISLLSFEDPISSDEAMNIDGDDDTPGQNEFWATRIPMYTPPPPPHRVVL